jgi:hypothetical protein
MSTKIRTTIMALVAAAVIAATSAPLTPVASAAKNNGGSQTSVGKVKQWKGTCLNAQVSFANAKTLAEVSAGEGDQAGFETAITIAQGIHASATASGCSIY